VVIPIKIAAATFFSEFLLFFIIKNEKGATKKIFNGIRISIAKVFHSKISVLYRKK
jgi:hypothetical protein